MSVCSTRRSVYGLWSGVEPTPGEYPIHLVHVVVRTPHAATGHRHNSERRAERALDSLICRIQYVGGAQQATLDTRVARVRMPG
jgi:hypothetical protein